MNTKWKLLLVQAIRECGPDDDDNGAKDKTLQRFAELMVKECLFKIEVWEQDSRNHVSYLLKQHFGIEQ